MEASTTAAHTDAAGEHRAALELGQKVLGLRTAALGAEHPETLVTQSPAGAAGVAKIN